MSRSTPLLSARGLSLAYRAGDSVVQALDGVDFDLDAGEFVAVTGPSGSGKSSLLHLLGGLVAPTSGSIRLAGDRIDGMDDERLSTLRRRKLGFVFQAFNLVEVLSALDNVALPLLIDGMPEEPARERARHLLDRVSLTHRHSHLPAELSGGERQRVAIARALAADPPLVLADEPTGNLDSVQGRKVMELLRELATGPEKALLVVTHDPGHAALADRIVELRDGRVTRTGPGSP